MKEVVRNHNDCYRFVDRACNELGMQFKGIQTIEIKPYRRPQTTPQSAKSNAMIRELAKEIGYSFDDLKTWLKLEFGPTTEFVFQGKAIIVPLSTTQYDREQTSEFIAQIERIGAEIVGFRFSHES